MTDCPEITLICYQYIVMPYAFCYVKSLFSWLLDVKSSLWFAVQTDICSFSILDSKFWEIHLKLTSQSQILCCNHAFKSWWNYIFFLFIFSTLLCGWKLLSGHSNMATSTKLILLLPFFTKYWDLSNSSMQQVILFLICGSIYIHNSFLDECCWWDYWCAIASACS